MLENSSSQLDKEQKYQDEQEKFNDIKKEIDYWSSQKEGSIGKEHHDRLLQRLNDLKEISPAEIELSKQKLDAIVLAEEGKNTITENKYQNNTLQQINDGSNKEEHGKVLGSCQGSGPVTFSAAPMKIEEIEKIEPMGLMIGGHVTPIDHGYYSGKKWKTPSERNEEEFVDVLAPAAGLVEVRSMPSIYASSKIGDYRLILRHTCTFYTIFIHVNQISEKLQKVADGKGFAKVEAGEVIGKAPGFDFSVQNDEVTLKGFVVPSSYDAEEWKIHTIDMFDSFSEPLRTQLLEKDIRQVLPRGGKIDYDIDGKLVGNWFEEGTNGYFGKKEYNRMPGYWKTHVAFAYDAYDPSFIIVSLGDFAAEAQQFAILGNKPDPKDVEVDSGTIKYELVNYDYKTDSSQNWDRRHFAKITKAYVPNNNVEGVVLVQMIEKRKMKMEVFPNKKASQVSAFTDKAKIYVR